MLRFVSNFPIARRLLAAFALAAFFPSVIIAIMGIYYVGQLNHRGSASNVISEAQDQTNTLSTTLHKMYTETKVLETQVAGMLAVPDSTSNATVRNTVSATVTQTTNQANSDAQQFANQLSNYQVQYDPIRSATMQTVEQEFNNAQPDSDVPQNESNLLHSVATDSWPKYLEAQNAELTLLQQIVNNPTRFTTSSAVQQLTASANTLNTSYDLVNSDWTRLTGYVTAISKYVNQVDATETQPIIISTAAAFVLSVMVIVFLGFIVQRSITIPLTELVSLTRRISKGDTNARAHVDSHDEIAIVANSMNNMMDNIVHLIQDTQAQRDVLQAQVEKLVSEVSGVGEGDLRVQAEVTADALGVLADSFNYMVEELGSLVVRVKMTAREVEESTTMTSDRMTELVETADRQIQQIASAAIEIERMAMTSQHVANRAQALASIAREARINAQGGRQAVQQTIEGMARIHSNVQETSNKVQTLGERSREINNIVDAISNIAHQTNRLALDAAIQAAMAGENGKGFGAVAADIRRLAERAKEQASSVGRIVRSVRDEIGAVAVSMRDTERETSAGAQLAEEAGTSLESIFSVIERQAREIEIINQMAMQQQQSSNEVVQIMQGVSESTQESSASTREAAQNMERMARLAEQLLASVEAFKLRDNMNYLTPNGKTSFMSDGDLTGQLTASGSFRTVTSTVQPISNGTLYGSGPLGSGGGNFPQPPQYSPAAPYGPNNGQQLFLPSGSTSGSLSFASQNNGQQVFTTQGNGPQPFSAQNNKPAGVPQWPAPDDWSPGNWNQPDWK
jgi:methyl-accepting chemotaxis protein